VKHSQLIITNRDTGDINKVPIEEILVLELDSPEISLNNYLLGELAVSNVVLLVNRMHMPISTIQPFYANTLHTKRFNYQLECTQRTKNRLWQFLVQGKIKHQANVLDAREKNSLRLHKLFSEVLTGDKGNREAQAAAYYWKQLMGKDFVRLRTGEYPNNLLNYGYAIIRSAMARALAAAGFHPALGFKHRNQYNPFCLADDMMKPYRPIVDVNVYDYYQEYPEEAELEQETKKFLIELLYSDIEIGGEKSNLQEAIKKTAQSLIKSFEDNKNQLLLPDLCT
jgi:CRISPR-associated protein Cas1